jgi:hypothetical protein
MARITLPDRTATARPGASGTAMAAPEQPGEGQGFGSGLED